MGDGRRRWREPTAKPGELKARYGKARGDAPDLLYAWGAGGAGKADARVLSEAFEHAPVFDGKSLREVLVERGYDITTLRFTIQQATPSPMPEAEIENEGMLR